MGERMPLHLCDDCPENGVSRKDTAPAESDADKAAASFQLQKVIVALFLPLMVFSVSNRFFSPIGNSFSSIAIEDIFNCK